MKQQLPAQEFYENSNYFIDVLKTEFCEDKGEGWYEIKKTYNMQTINEELSEDEKDNKE